MWCHGDLLLTRWTTIQTQTQSKVCPDLHGLICCQTRFGAGCRPNAMAISRALEVDRLGRQGPMRVVRAYEFPGAFPQPQPEKEL